MIIYKSGLTNLCQINGSVFPKALRISVPASVFAGVLSFLIWDERLEFMAYFRDENSVMNDNAAWGGFSFFVGFLVVFRTSQAYNRFWEGTSATHKMGAEWFDACAALISFCRHSGADREKVMNFQNLIVRLFSMLHACALGELEDCGEIRDYASVSAFSLELIDGKGIDEESLRAIRDCDAKVELLFQWIQGLIVENVKLGVMSIPPPILTRSYQELANGMVAFHDALKISKVPFPFPYAQTCDCLLMIHWLIVPFVVSQWCHHPAMGFVFCFMQVFTLWSLNLIAVEIENPFGTDPNDVDGVQMQLQMNNNLRLLLRGEVATLPSIRTMPGESQKDLILRVTDDPTDKKISFVGIWEELHIEEYPLLEKETLRASTACPKQHAFVFISRRFSPEHDAYVQKQVQRRSAWNKTVMASAAKPKNSWEPMNIGGGGADRAKSSQRGHSSVEGVADQQFDFTEGAKAEPVYQGPGLRTALGTDLQGDPEAETTPEVPTQGRETEV